MDYPSSRVAMKDCLKIITDDLEQHQIFVAENGFTGCGFSPSSGKVYLDARPICGDCRFGNS